MKSLLKLTYVISLLLTLSARIYLPEQYFRDSNYINERINSSVSGHLDSFAVMTKFYSTMHLMNDSNILIIFQWMIFSLVLFFALKLCWTRNVAVNFISIYYLLLIPFYGSMMTKEILVSLLILLTLILRNIYQRSTFVENIQYIPLLILIALSIRNYYFLTLILFLSFRFMSHLLGEKILIIIPFIVPIATTLIYALNFHYFVQARYIFEARMQVVDALRIRPRTTIAQGMYGENFFHNAVTYFDVMRQMFLPFSIASGSLYNVLTLVPILIISSIAFKLFRDSWSQKKLSQHAVLFFSYLTIATIFEPDLGSFLRHTFPYLPILILAFSASRKLT
jgi:hypothetical protein